MRAPEQIGGNSINVTDTASQSIKAGAYLLLPFCSLTKGSFLYSAKSREVFMKFLVFNCLIGIEPCFHVMLHSVCKLCALQLQVNWMTSVQ